MRGAQILVWYSLIIKKCAREARVSNKDVGGAVTKSAGDALAAGTAEAKASTLRSNSIQAELAINWRLSYAHPRIAGERSSSCNSSLSVALGQGLSANCTHGLSGELEG